MNSMLKNKTFLITGGTGSFGEAMVKFLIKTKIFFIAELEYL